MLNPPSVSACRCERGSVIRFPQKTIGFHLEERNMNEQVKHRLSAALSPLPDAGLPANAGKQIQHRNRGWAQLYLPLLTSALLFSAAANGQGVLGQPTNSDVTLASRCPGQFARFNYSSANGGMFGPSGIAVDLRGRLLVTDYGGHRVLTWPDVDALNTCKSADGVFGADEMTGPEAIAIDVRTETVFVADTLSHTVVGYRYLPGTAWTKVLTLGSRGVSGNGYNQFYFPRGLTVDSNGRLFVADDYNNRILMFDQPFSDGQYASDSIAAGADGGFNHPKGLAISGNALFVADFYNNRVLRFTGPFTTPDQTYVATGIFTGLNQPVDVAVHADGSLLVMDQGNRRVVSYKDAAIADSLNAPNGTWLYQGLLNSEPLGVACDRSGRIYMADYQSFRVIIRGVSSKLPISVGSSVAARTLLTNLYAAPDKAAARVAVGQQLTTYLYGTKSDPNAWYGAWLKMQQANLPLPKVMGGELSDLMTYEGFYPNQDALNELIRHGQAGNIVTLVWHMDNPTQGDFNTPISTSDLHDVVDMNTATGQRFQAQLDLAANVLHQFQNANVPVLFRPLHEQNGTFFWWGHDGSSGAAQRDRQAAWVAMWRKMVTELTVNNGLHNLLFVFGVNQLDDYSFASPLTYYPGGAWADVVSIDIYNDQLYFAGNERGMQHYTALISTGKPFGLSEFGQSVGDNGTGPDGSGWDARTLANRVLDSYARATFAVAWYSSSYDGASWVWALPDVSYTRELLMNPLMYTQPH
jgi:hypothetical protein